MLNLLPLLGMLLCLFISGHFVNIGCRESYNRAYKVAVRIQQLSELEEIIEYKRSRENPERQAMIRSAWKLR